MSLTHERANLLTRLACTLRVAAAKHHRAIRMALSPSTRRSSPAVAEC